MPIHHLVENRTAQHRPTGATAIPRTLKRKTHTQAGRE